MQSHALNLQGLPLPIAPTPNFQLCIQCPLQNDLHLSFASDPTCPHKKHPSLSKLCTFMNSNFIFFSHLPLFQGLAQMFLSIGSCLALSSLMVGLVSYSFFLPENKCVFNIYYWNKKSPCESSCEIPWWYCFSELAYIFQTFFRLTWIPFCGGRKSTGAVRLSLLSFPISLLLQEK